MKGRRIKRQRRAGFALHPPITPRSTRTDARNSRLFSWFFFYLYYINKTMGRTYTRKDGTIVKYVYPDKRKGVKASRRDIGAKVKGIRDNRVLKRVSAYIDSLTGVETPAEEKTRKHIILNKSEETTEDKTDEATVDGSPVEVSKGAWYYDLKNKSFILKMEGN